MKTHSGLSQLAIAGWVVAAIVAVVAITYLSQALVEREALTQTSSSEPSALKGEKEQREIDKLAAEIRQIRSDTAGSLFWLKMIALFVTVGGAVGGYLVAQSKNTRQRIDFENRMNVDAVYQSIVQELSADSPLLRAAAAVKLGALLHSFPSEWNVGDSYRHQLVTLTKQVMAASLAIETIPKVLKTLTIQLVRHHPWNDEARKRIGDARELDLSHASAADAYWARVDFSYADFYQANLTEASFREAVLHGSQFREANLCKAVLIRAVCSKANFKLADLRHTDLTDAVLVEAEFEGTKVYGATLSGAISGKNKDTQVDNSPAGDGSAMVPVREWLALSGARPAADVMNL